MDYVNSVSPQSVMAYCAESDLGGKSMIQGNMWLTITAPALSNSLYGNLLMRTYCMCVCVCVWQQLHPNWDLEPVAFAPERFTFKPARSQMLRISDNTFTPWTLNATRQTPASNRKRQQKCITVETHTAAPPPTHPNQPAYTLKYVSESKHRFFSPDSCQLMIPPTAPAHTHTCTHTSVPGIIIRVMNSHILPRQNLSAAVSRKPEHHVFSLLISSSFPADVMKPLCVCVCLYVCGFFPQMCVFHSGAAAG